MDKKRRDGAAGTAAARGVAWVFFALAAAASAGCAVSESCRRACFWPWAPAAPFAAGICALASLGVLVALRRRWVG